MSETHEIEQSTWQIVVFQFKSKLLILKRSLQNLFANIRTFPKTRNLESHPIISFSQSELWNANDNEANWILTAGKIENLRRAAKKLDGLEVKENSVFSFWQHMGYPGAVKGFVLGREIREGCIVPTIAGGICQLSNALYDAALKANFKIIERHQHTKVIHGSLAERGRDATVKWNYIDLRFKSKHPFRIEVELTEDKLIVKFKGDVKRMLVKEIDTVAKASFYTTKLNDCYSCGNYHCVKYTVPSTSLTQQTRTAFILDEKWSEFDDYISSISNEKDLFILPFPKFSILPSRFCWTIGKSKSIKSFWPLAIQRAIYTRLKFNKARNVFAQMIDFDERIAIAAARKIPYTKTHLIVSQNLVPFLWEKGAFGGRTFDVIMTRQPLENLHDRLDQTLRIFPESKTLNDFRASQTLVNLENAALRRADKIITPHGEIVDLFVNKAIKLPWNLPKKAVLDKRSVGNKVLFPASALARKGAYEIRRLAQELDLCVVLAGKAIEHDHFFDGIVTEFAGSDPFDQVKLIIYPVHVEHQPRLVLEALSKGIPVITTTASGLAPSKYLTIVPIGDYVVLKNAVEAALKNDSLLHPAK